MNAGDRILVAVSGGPDSLALLHGLHRVAPRLGIAIEAATVNHGLRPEALVEAEGVAGLCAGLGVPCHILAVDVARQRGPHVSLQDAARRARLAALQACAEGRDCRAVALGHTADDQAETILFRIVRGTGVRGLTGIPYRRGPLIRPLLDVRRAQVLAYLRRRGVTFVEDPANRDPRHTRSRVRHEWLPFLARENPRIVEALLGLADEASRAQPSGDAHDSLPPLARGTRRTLRRLVDSGSGTRRIDAPGGTIEIVYGQPRFEPDASANGVVTLPVSGAGLASQHVSGVALPIGQALQWGPAKASRVAGGHERARDISMNREVVIEAVIVAGSEGPPASGPAFSVAACAAGLCVRPARSGDRMRPRGGLGSRKLQDLLVDAKIPRALRGGLPVVTNAAGVILYVPGLRPAEDARPASDARQWVEIRVR